MVCSQAPLSEGDPQGPSSGCPHSHSQLCTTYPPGPHVNTVGRGRQGASLPEKGGRGGPERSKVASVPQWRQVLPKCHAFASELNVNSAWGEHLALSLQPDFLLARPCPAPGCPRTLHAPAPARHKADLPPPSFPPFPLSAKPCIGISCLSDLPRPLLPEGRAAPCQEPPTPGEEASSPWKGWPIKSR